MNLYGDVGGDPVNEFDPLGNQSFGFNPLGKVLLKSGRDAQKAAKGFEKQKVYDTVVEIAGIQDDLAKRFLHHYIWDNGEDIVLTSAEFLDKIRPNGSVYNPNKWGGGFRENLKTDLMSHEVGKIAFFNGKYTFGVFDTGNKTAGIGLAAMTVDASVCSAGSDNWFLQGKASLLPDRWDFDWKLVKLIKEQTEKLKVLGPQVDYKKGADLAGRETRTALGSAIPGTPFLVKVQDQLNVTESNGDASAHFTK